MYVNLKAVMPSDWVEISEAQMQGLVDATQYVKEAVGDGTFFVHRHNGKRFAVETNDGKFFADPAAGDRVPRGTGM